MQWQTRKVTRNNMYKWAVNSLKLERAIKKVGKDDEDLIKEQYILLGGKVLDIPKRPGRPFKDDQVTPPDFTKL